MGPASEVMTRVEREEMAVKSTRTRNSSQERLRDATAAKARGNRFWGSYQSEYIGIGKHGRQRLKHALAAALGDQPVMNDRHPHV
jgi:hypothetical protein